MRNNKETPTAVRVARWTALTAAITALGTIGNTFIENRPWFLEHETPRQVERVVTKEAGKTESVSPVIHLNVPNVSYNLKKLTTESSMSDAAVMSVPPPPPPPPNVTMSAVPNMGLWTNTLNFMIYRPITFTIIAGSIILLVAYSFVEYRYRKKKNLPFTG